jgi:phage shock protein A
MDIDNETIESPKAIEEIKTDLQKASELRAQINFHKVAVAEVKRRLGKTCTYLSHLTKKKKIEEVIETEGEENQTITKVVDRIYFLSHLIVNGEKKIVRFDTGKNSSTELVAEDYKALKEQIEQYVTGKKSL